MAALESEFLWLAYFPRRSAGWTAMRRANRWIGWVVGLVLLVWRRSCRYRVIGDQRPRLRAEGTPYVYALLHAYQVSAVFVTDE